MNERRTMVAACLLAPLLMGAAEPPTRTPEEALQMVKEGTAVLVDVREEAEWVQTGVAEPAQTLALSDLKASRSAWKPFLEANGDRELILYCRSGNRSGQAAALLASEGFGTSNAGGLRDWIAAGLPVREVKPSKAKP